MFVKNNNSENFFKVDIDFFNNKDLSRDEKFTLMYLMSNNEDVWNYTINGIAKDLDLSARTIKNHLKVLKEKGYLKIDRINNSKQFVYYVTYIPFVFENLIGAKNCTINGEKNCTDIGEKNCTDAI